MNRQIRNSLIRIAIALVVLVAAFWGWHVYVAKADIYGSSLVGWWTMDSNDISGTSVTDNSGNGNTGTTIGGPTATVGKLGQALHFDGVTQNVVTALTTALTDFTACVWANIPNQSNGGDNRFLDKSYTGGFWMGIQTVGTGCASGDTGCWGGGIEQGGPPYGLFVTVPNPNDHWHFICSERSGTTQTVSADGGQETATQTVSGAAMDASQLRIGIADSGGGPIQGSIDDVRIYNRALSPAEIQQLYYQGLSTHGGAGVF